MKLHNLKPAEGSTHKAIRIGRGEASGKGGTSTKGNKGGQSRAGYKSKMAHEGGQMPIQRRVPKRGFKNINRERGSLCCQIHVGSPICDLEKLLFESATAIFFQENVHVCPWIRASL